MASQIPYLDVQNLTKRFGAQVLFDKISFSIAEGQKVGLVARNGTGKSTLMSVLMDKEGHESGDIIYRRDLKIGYLEQSPQFDPEESVLDACFNHEGDPEKVLRAKQILTQLHITNMEQPMGQLSGGQQKRVALANVLIEEPDFLMLDEPTNHLDLEMIEWLEGYLNRGNKTIFMVTHDRFFLDKVCNTILELDDKTIYTYRGNYAYYLEKRQERMDNLRAEIQHSKNLYRRELDWMRRQPQARGHKAKYREDAFYELEKVAKQRIEDRQVRLKASTVYIGSKIFECQYVSKAFDDRGKKKVILDNFYYNFARFEKMGIVGNNGTGKSTFIKMLLGEVQPDSGKFDIGETVRFGYFSQEGLKFKEDQKVIDVITEIADYIDLGNGKHMTASQFLQVLEEYLQDFAGCVIVVSHDRYFMDKVVDHLLVFKGEGEIQDFPGNYTQYRDWSKLQEKDEAEKAAAAAKTASNNAAVNDGAGTAKRDANFENKRKMSYKEKREYEQLTQEIDKLTEEQKKLEEALCSGTLSVDELTEKSKRLPEIKDELDEKEMRWLELSEML